eukprot:scaffold245_cov113-Isochrysis_galbana.AAC.2
MSPAQTSTLSSSVIRVLEHRTSKIYVLAVATVLSSHMLTGYALCTPVLGQFRAWVAAVKAGSVSGRCLLLLVPRPARCSERFT